MTTFLRGDFSHAVASDHRRLSARCQQLEQSLTSASLDDSQVHEELRHLEHELDQHFTEEEQGGLFTQVLAECPHFGHRIERLAQQHREFQYLIRALRSTCRLACGDSGARDGWLAAFADFTRTFARHEQAEHELLLDAAEEDLGSGD
jgi:hypothetical protein